MLFLLHLNFEFLQCRNFASFNFTFSQCSTAIFQAFDKQTVFSQVFYFTILSYSGNSQKFPARKKWCGLQ